MASITWASVEGPSGTVRKQPTLTWRNGRKQLLPVFPHISGNFKYGQSGINEGLDSILPPFSLFACHVWYQYHGRNLTREECRSMMRMIFGDAKLLAMAKQIDRFDNPDDGMTRAFNAVGDAVKAAWSSQVEIWFKQLQEDPKTKDAAKARIEALDGFTGRVPHLPMKTSKYWPMINGEYLEPYQIYINYGLLHWGRDREGNRFSESTSRRIWIHYNNYAPQGAFTMIDKLLNQRTSLFQDVASVIEHEPLKSQIKQLAEKVINDFEVKVLNLEPRPGMETASQSDPLSTTTTEMGGLSLTATAGSSRQPITQDADEEDIFTKYLNADEAYATSEPDDTPPDPVQSDIKGKGKGSDRGDDRDKGNDKGKGRARDSPSESSGSGAAGKGKGKKKPRRS